MYQGCVQFNRKMRTRIGPTKIKQENCGQVRNSSLTLTIQSNKKLISHRSHSDSVCCLFCQQKLEDLPFLVSQINSHIVSDCFCLFG